MDKKSAEYRARFIQVAQANPTWTIEKIEATIAMMTNPKVSAYSKQFGDAIIERTR